jgi:hypothetical protein
MGLPQSSTYSVCPPFGTTNWGATTRVYCNINSLHWDRMVNMLYGSILGAMWLELKRNSNQDYNTIEELNPVLFSVKANANDNLTWNQGMGGKNAEGYWQACIKEYKVLLKKDLCVEVIK